MDPRIALALEHKDRINAHPRRWASFECANFGFSTVLENGDFYVILRIGVINSLGQKERCDVTRHYFNHGDKTHFRSVTHP